MKYLYLKDLLLEIPTQVTNTTGSLTGIKGLLIQVRTLRQASYIFRSRWGTAQSGEEKVFYFDCAFPCCCLWTCRSHDPAFPQLSQLSALKPFSSSSLISPLWIILWRSYLYFLHLIFLIFFHGLVCFFVFPTSLFVSSIHLYNSASHFTFLKSLPEGLTA